MTPSAQSVLILCTNVCSSIALCQIGNSSLKSSIESGAYGVLAAAQVSNQGLVKLDRSEAQQLPQIEDNVELQHLIETFAPGLQVCKYLLSGPKYVNSAYLEPQGMEL